MKKLILILFALSINYACGEEDIANLNTEVINDQPVKKKITWGEKVILEPEIDFSSLRDPEKTIIKAAYEALNNLNLKVSPEVINGLLSNLTALANYLKAGAPLFKDPNAVTIYHTIKTHYDNINKAFGLEPGQGEVYQAFKFVMKAIEKIKEANAIKVMPKIPVTPAMPAEKTTEQSQIWFK